MFDVRSRAMLANLTLCQWSAKARDRKATRQVARFNGAKPRAGQYTKQLVGYKALAELRRIAREARRHHRSNTLAWFDKGPRLLPSRNYFEYINGQRDYESQHESARDDFCGEIDTHKDDAVSVLSGLYREGDYPDLATLKSKFVFKTQICPIPDGHDDRIDLSREVMDHLKENWEADIVSAQEGAMQDLWQRVYDAVSRMSRVLTNYTLDPATGRMNGAIHDSMVTSVRDIADLLPRLNVAGDANLDYMREELVQSLCPHDAKDLRSDGFLRRSVASEADRILEQMADFVGMDLSENAA